MMTLSIDLETFSDVDIAKCGAYKYAESPNFEILLFAYSIDGGEVQVIDLAQGEEIPEEIIHMVVDEKVMKTAYNAVFERVCLSTYLHRHYPSLISSRYLSPYSWRCTMVWAAYCGYPLSLKDAGMALGLEKQKLEEGKELIRYFCVPCNPTKTNGGRTRNLPIHAKEKWELFKRYNKRDVEVELQIQDKLSFNPVPDSVWDEYHIDQEINDRGILVDMQMVENAIRLDKRTRDVLVSTMQKITELENPNSVQQLREWLGKSGTEMDSLDKKDVAAILPNTTGDVKKVLQLRQQLAKSSVKKYHAMENAAGDDNRARGMFQFYGANRTGRFCLSEGTMILVKNWEKIYEKPIEEVTTQDLVWDGDNWVEHEGVVFSGDKEVIEWDDVIATPEHKVWISSTEKVMLRDAMDRRVPLWRGNGKYKTEGCKTGQTGITRTYDIINAGPNNRFMANGRIVSNSGRHVQLQNLPQNHLSDLDEARGLVKDGNFTAMELLYDDIPDTLSQLIRTAFIPAPGYKYYVADFSAIEARVLSFLAGEQWRIDVFATGGDIYCASASQMFKVPVEKHGVNGHLRQKGKIAELALGYGGGRGALTAMGALSMGIKEEELQPLVDAWRQANPQIVRFWWNVDNMIKKAIKEQTTTKLGSISFQYAGTHLFIQLPSGRKLSYVEPRIGENKFGGESIQYMGVGATKKWELLESYGPKFVENIIQAISRDILCYAMKNLRDERIVAHVHDELIIECTPDTKLEDICERMGSTPPWIEGLYLRADGFVADYYKKD